MHFTGQRAKEVVIKARGRFVSRVVDIIVEILRKKFLTKHVDVNSI